LLYGVPDVGYFAWIGILLVVSSIGLVSVLMRAFSCGANRDRGKNDSIPCRAVPRIAELNSIGWIAYIRYLIQLARRTKDR